ncbi:UNKNOWN [Stylonychia lemnae]|uniref:DOMON domain-containing protein n=1 Tax=Stylonychia lemnae TaxID=5949 RepID=A0A077ZR24_STYLE|nr:UNKNOWN [Stylonychia lemnae]|eukprot:CDW71904.1 UNKNOWN [Stylonychia lemnae]
MRDKLSLLLISLVLFSLLPVESTILEYTFADPIYQLHYEIDQSLAKEVEDTKVIMTLVLNNYDISSWSSANGQQGVWLGIGYGSKTMTNTDMVTCRYYYTNSQSDIFHCSDQYTDNSRGRFNDTTQSIQNVKTNSNPIIKTAGQTLTKANFSVSFERLFATKDLNSDYVLSPKIEFSIYAFGSISGGAVQPCTAANRGFKYLDLSQGYIESFSTSANIIQICTSLIIVSLFILNDSLF